MDTDELLHYQWPYLLGCLPPLHLDESAQKYGAITRRRNVNSASTLLRLALAYGFGGDSLRHTAAWAEAAGVASISDVALLKRLRKAASWLGFLVAAKLADTSPPPLAGERRVRLVDATTIQRIGHHGTDYRLHLGYDLTHQAFDHLELTDRHGGESLTRFTFAPGELVLADRGYAHRRGLAHVRQAGADFLVRLNWRLIPLQTLAGGPFDLLTALRSLPEAQPREFAVVIAPVPTQGLPSLPVRLIALRRSEAAATETRREIIRHSTHHRQIPEPRTLEVAGYICLLTSLDPVQLPTREALELYRFRWQVELAFKRIKNLVALGQLPAKDPDLTRSLVFSKLLAALLVDDLTGRYLALSPWGYSLGTTPAIALANGPIIP